MGKIACTDSLNLDIKDLDSQHMKFLKIVNELLKAVEEKKTHEKQSKIIDDLISYAFYHFSKEERYFNKAKYPGAKKHMKEHEQFVDKITEFKNDFNNKKITLSIKMIHFMNNWWINHIRVSDRQYLPYVKANLV